MRPRKTNYVLKEGASALGRFLHARSSWLWWYLIAVGFLLEPFTRLLPGGSGPHGWLTHASVVSMVTKMAVQSALFLCGIIILHRNTLYLPAESVTRSWYNEYREIARALDGTSICMDPTVLVELLHEFDRITAVLGERAKTAHASRVQTEILQERQNLVSEKIFEVLVAGHAAAKAGVDARYEARRKVDAASAR